MSDLLTSLGRLVFRYPAKLLHTILLWWASRRRLLVLARLTGSVIEQEGGGRRLRGRARRTVLLPDWLESLEMVGRDPSVACFRLRLGPVDAGWAQLEELRSAIGRLRARGKRCFVYLEQVGHKEYFLASAFERITVAPQATLDLVGLRAEVTFFKGGFDRLGVKAHFESVGDYKSFGEPYVREHMSEAFRESLDYVLSGLQRSFCKEVAEARGLGQTDVQGLLDDGPMTSSEALDAGLVDSVVYPDEWKKEVKKLLGVQDEDSSEDTATAVPFHRGWERPLKTIRFRPFLRPWRLLRRLERLGIPAPRIAVVVAAGPIISWEDEEIPAGRIGGRPLAKLIRKLARNRSISAVVLRIDSPGGSGLVSDQLWRELRRLKKRKPLVASMGSTAASGGYYLSMAADRIHASPTTITGSIGVVAGKFDVSGLLEKLGLNQEVLSYGKNSGLYSPTSGLTEDERSRLQVFLKEFYGVFVGKAAECRGMEADALEEHARGRIWTGNQALERGLVDAVGGLDSALVEAARLARVVGGWETLWFETPRPGLLARFQGMVPSLRTGTDLLEGARGDLLDLRTELVQARLPFEIRFR